MSLDNAIAKDLQELAELREVFNKHEDRFNEGARYVLEYLEELYEGIRDTDIWADFMEDNDE